MSSILHINRLVVTKDGKSAYDQKFHSGLNIIHGSNGSGKSSILDFIFFALGGNLTKWKPVAQLCDKVFIEITANGIVLSLMREVSTDPNRPMYIYFGRLEDGLLAAAEAWQRYPYARTEHSKSFSQVLFKALDLPEIPGDEGSNITMHQVLRMMYVDQTTPFQRIFRSEDFDSRDTREAVSELLCGIGNNELYSKRIALREQKKIESEFGSKLVNLLRATATLGENFNAGAFEAELGNLSLRRDTLQKQVEEIHGAVSNSSEVAKAAENERRKLYQEVSRDREALTSLEREINSVAYEIADSGHFIEHMVKLLRDFDRTAVTYTSIGEVPFELCPACPQPLVEIENRCCHLCRQKLPIEHKEAKIFELRMDIEGQISESKSLKEQREAKLTDLKKRATRIKSAMSRKMKLFNEIHDASVDGRTALISEKSREIGKIDARIDEINKLTELREEINTARKYKEVAAAKVSQIKNDIEALEVSRERRRSEVKTRIVNQTKRFLMRDLKEHNDFEELENFDFSFEEDWFAVNGNPNITTSASGMVVVKNSLFMGLLLSSLQDFKMMYPRLLLLDNVEDKGMVVERVRNFQKAIADLTDEESAPHQIIMTTSTLNRELERDDYIVGPEYTKDHRTLAIVTRR